MGRRRKALAANRRCAACGMSRGKVLYKVSPCHHIFCKKCIVSSVECPKCFSRIVGKQLMKSTLSDLRKLKEKRGPPDDAAVQRLARQLGYFGADIDAPEAPDCIKKWKASEWNNLNLSGSEVRDLRPLRSATSLVLLNLRGCKNINKGFGVISELPRLQHLYLDRTNFSGECLWNISELLGLSCAACPRLCDATPIARMKCIRYVNLSWCPQLRKGLNALCSLRNLRALHLDGTRIDTEALMHLRGNSRLVLLHCGKCRFLKDISPIGEIKSLQDVSLSNSKNIEKGFEALLHLGRLTKLHVRHVYLPGELHRLLKARGVNVMS